MTQQTIRISLNVNHKSLNKEISQKDWQSAPPKSLIFEMLGSFLVTRGKSCVYVSLFASILRITLLSNMLSHVYKYLCNDIEIEKSKRAKQSKRERGNVWKSRNVLFLSVAWIKLIYQIRKNVWK